MDNGAGVSQLDPYMGRINDAASMGLGAAVLGGGLAAVQGGSVGMVARNAATSGLIGAGIGAALGGDGKDKLVNRTSTAGMIGGGLLGLQRGPIGGIIGTLSGGIAGHLYGKATTAAGDLILKR
jgi:hypothetical protein